MNELLNSTLFQLGDHTIKVISILYIFIYAISVFIFLQIIKRLIYSTKSHDLAKKFAIYSLLKYFFLVIAFVVGLELMGFSLSVLIAGSAALLVGIGLGLQNLFSDFVSGIIILVDGSVKVDDVIEVNGLVCRVQEINLRTTTVFTREDKYIILPNSDLTRLQLINWTHNKKASRFDVTVGVDYNSDIKLVMQLMKEAAVSQTNILKTPEPFVRFEEYGESRIKFTVFFWTENVFRVENILSNTRIKIFELFRENKIVIPFPQRVVHLSKEDEFIH
ncbi:MAG: mechanosensitive ion channel [Bacteroidetes bacterium]|nr:mechanosensitive ion channel [Bacteroidota bacterium]